MCSAWQQFTLLHVQARHSIHQPCPMRHELRGVVRAEVQRATPTCWNYRYLQHEVATNHPGGRPHHFQSLHPVANIFLKKENVSKVITEQRKRSSRAHDLGLVHPDNATFFSFKLIGWKDAGHGFGPLHEEPHPFCLVLHTVFLPF